MKRACTNDECGWRGETNRMIGGIGPVCPQCGDTTEALGKRLSDQPSNWTNSKMNPWKPDNNEAQARRIGKTLEEAGELVSVLGRISIQGIDAIDPSSGKTNRQRLLEETGDVLAQINCNLVWLHTDLEREFITARMVEKRRQMEQWEAHYTAGTESPVVAALRIARVYVHGAYECAFPDEVANRAALRMIDEAIRTAK